MRDRPGTPRCAQTVTIQAHAGPQLQSGTHSILDVSRVLDRGDPPEFGAVEVLSAVDLLGRGGGLPTRDHTDLVDEIVREEWAPNRVARCTVLYDDAGKPDEIYFSGITGD